MFITNINKPTATGRASWFVRFWFHLCGGQTKLYKPSVCYVKKASAPVICEEECEIPDAVHIYGRLRVDTIAVQVHEDEFQAPKNIGKAPTPIVPNPDQIIQPPVPPNNQEVVETQPVITAED